MLEIPYKLDLILDTQYKYGAESESESESKENLPKINYKTKSDEHINFKKPIVDVEINSFVNKLKLIILNMGKSDIYWLEADKKTGFDLKIEITNKDRLNEKNYSEYVMSNGIVGPIKLNPNSELKNYIHFDSDDLVIKPIDYPITNIGEFINKWRSDKNIYPLNIPEIYFYGEITNGTGDLLSYYYITKKYPNYISVLEHKNFNFSLTYLKKLLELFDNLISRKYVFRNLNMFGLGLGYNVDRNSTDFSIMILDYTMETLLNLENVFFDQFKISRCGNKKCIGNLTPYYVIDDYYNLENNWLPRLNKFYSLGLVEIILTLFYTNDDNLSKIYDFIIGPSVFESQLHYYHFYERFNSGTNIHNLNLLINDLKLRYCGINPLMENELKLILINLLSKNYDSIHYPHQILKLIERIEKSNDEFEIEYLSKEQIYNPMNNNYLKTNTVIKNKILSDDTLNLDNTLNSDIGYGHGSGYGHRPESGSGSGSGTGYHELYKKYKNKYLKLKYSYHKKN